MKQFYAILSFVLVVSIGLLAIGGLASLVAIFFGLPVGWGIALAIYGLAFASNGWKGLTNLGLGTRGISNNAEAAYALLHITALLGGVAFALSPAPHNTSALWALLLPLLFIPALGLQLLLNFVLDAVYKDGRKP